jgi:hypothetical protein
MCDHADLHVCVCVCVCVTALTGVCVWVGGFAQLVLDGRGKVVKGFEKGNFLGPTVLDNVNPGNPGYHEEICGPVRAFS